MGYRYQRGFYPPGAGTGAAGKYYDDTFFAAGRNGSGVWRQARFDMVVCTNLFMVMDSLATVQKRSVFDRTVFAEKARIILFDFRNASKSACCGLNISWRRCMIKRSKGHNLSTYYPSDIAAGLADAHMSIVDRKCIGLPFLSVLAPVIIIKARKI